MLGTERMSSSQPKGKEQGPLGWPLVTMDKFPSIQGNAVIGFSRMNEGLSLFSQVEYNCLGYKNPTFKKNYYQQIL
jgi:hypothetical protein